MKENRAIAKNLGLTVPQCRVLEKVFLGTPLYRGSGPALMALINKGLVYLHGGPGGFYSVTDEGGDMVRSLVRQGWTTPYPTKFAVN